MIINTGINKASQIQFSAWINENARDGITSDYSNWVDELTLDENGMHFELRAFYSKSGNPVTTSFDASDCDFEDIGE